MNSPMKVLVPSPTSKQHKSMPQKPKRALDLLDEEPNMIINTNVKVKGDMKFEGLLRIDGTVQGQIAAPLEASLILSETGVFLGDIAGLTCAYINGKVTGDIIVEHLAIGSNAVIHGDLTCKTIEIDAYAVIIGQMQISRKNIITSNYKPSPLSSTVDGKEEEDGGPGVSVKDFDELNDEEKAAYLASPKKNANNNQQDDDDAADSLDGDTNTQQQTETPPVPKRGHKNVLFIHEPQVDFYTGGACCGPSSGSMEYGAKIAEFIENNLDNIDEIYLTLDSHSKIHMSHRGFWCDADGNMPEINTVVSAEDIRENAWLPRKKELKDYCIQVLEAQAKHSNHGDGVTIKPEHCSIGSQGGAILPIINHALSEWVTYSLNNVNYITRDPALEIALNSRFVSGNTTSTSTSTVSVPYDLEFLKQFGSEDKLLICGQAASHCAYFSIADIVTSAVAATTAGASEGEQEDPDVNTEGGNGDAAENSNTGLTLNNVFILKDALVTSTEQLGITVSTAEAMRTNTVEGFWKHLRTTGAKITTTVEAFL